MGQSCVSKASTESQMESSVADHNDGAAAPPQVPSTILVHTTTQSRQSRAGSQGQSRMEVPSPVPRAKTPPPIFGEGRTGVLIIQNDLICAPATATATLTEHEINYQVIYAFHDKAFKHIKPYMYEAIIVLGGRADVYSEDEYPWLINEKQFIKQALELDIPILGICLGCQMLAECVGGKVFPGKYGNEVGYKDWQFESTNSNDDKNNGNNGNNGNNTKNSKNDKNKDGKNKDGSNDNGKDNDNDDDFDAFLYALKDKNLDKYVVLFHGDTFSLPDKYVNTKKNKELEVKLLAKTDKYPTLFKVGKYSYGFQGHPELTPELLFVWCRGWGDEWLKRLTIDIEKDVIQRSWTNYNQIIFSGKLLFDIWIDIILNDECHNHIKEEFEKYMKTHWNDNINASENSITIKEDLIAITGPTSYNPNM